MIKIENVYDALADLVETALTGYARLPNAYVIEQNTYLQLRKGYALAVSPGVNTQRYVGCLTSWERNFTLTLINQVTTTQNNLGSRELLEKALLDDHEKILSAMENEVSLGGVVIKSTVVSDNGISFIDTDIQKFFSMTIEIFTEYQYDPRG